MIIMKKIFILFIFLIIVFLVVFFMFKGVFNKKEINSIKELAYDFSDGRSMFGKVSYHLICNDKCILSSKLDGYPDDELFEVEMNREDVDKILKLLQENRAGSWDGFNKADSRVLDGKSYNFKVFTQDNQTVSVHGYMAYPRRFNETIKQIVEIFDKANDTLCFDLLEHENYKGFKEEDVTKVIEEFYGEGGVSTKEYNTKEEIEGIVNRFKKIKLGIETKRSCVDNTKIYRFIMKDGKEYMIEEECDWFVLDQKNYISFYKN